MSSIGVVNAISTSTTRSRCCVWERFEGPIEPGVNPGEWKCKVTARTGRSSRRLGVAVVVIRDDHLFLMTVEWEDVK